MVREKERGDEARSMDKVQIFAIDSKGEREEIQDLYWFEENFVHSFAEGLDNYHDYTFEIFVNDVRVYPSPK